MKILVAVKRVADASCRVYPSVDGTGVDLSHAKMSLNPFCEVAVEAAVRFKEAGRASEVVAVSIGPRKAQDQLRQAMAMGADRAILVESEAALEPLDVAKCLRAICTREQPDLILLGKQSIDTDNHQTGQMLAALLGLPQGVCAAQIQLEDQSAFVVRDIDGGSQSLRLALPAVITCDLRLNEPRFTSLPAIMQARKKPLEMLSLAELDVAPRPHTRLLGVRQPPPRGRGVMVHTVDELLHKLRQEAKVI